MRILLINNYDSYADLLAYTLWCVSGTRPTIVYNDACTADALLARNFDRIVLSPGPGHPSEPRDFGVCAEIIARSTVPLLGVCLGHQGIAMVHGGDLVLAPKVKHGKRSNIEHDGHAIFEGIPSPFAAMRYHSWVVDARQLPGHIQVLARALDDDTIMALAVRDRPVVGVQFHPESVGTLWGRWLLRNFVRQNDQPRTGARSNVAPKKAPPAGPPPRGARHATTANKTPEEAESPSIESAARGAANVAPKRSPPKRHLHRPQRRVLVEPLRWREPEEVFAHHYARRPYAFWLDSAAPVGGQRWSFMGAPHQVLQAQHDRIMKITPRSTTGVARGDPWQALRQALEAPPDGLDALPCPFAGGLVGYLGYEIQRYCHDATDLGSDGSVSDARAPHDSVMQVCRRFLAFDHVERRVYAVVVQRNAAAAGQWLRTMQASWRERWPDLLAIHTSGHCAPGDYWPPQVQPRIDRSGYLRRIAEAQAHIARGEIYEVCMSNRFEAKCEVDPWHLYRILRHTHPAPYAAYLKSPTTSVLSASPERFLTLDAAGQITTEPIKGTRSHVGTPGALAFQRRQLQHSAKDQAELLMIVDLLRNDLARVATRHSVTTSNLFELTDHPTVVQMAATITAQLRRGCDAIDLLRACFPGGSIVGAPKRRAMEVINALETKPRGPYTGAIGYCSTDGAMALNIAIRTMVCCEKRITFGAGGAITADSDPKEECEEIESKAFALARAVALAQLGACGNLRLKTSRKAILRGVASHG